MKVICGIYIIISPCGRVYIGQAEDIFKRWFKDYFNLRNCKGQIRLYNSFLFYGVENHIFQIVQECTLENLDKCERYWQDYYDVTSKKGLNCILKDTNEKHKICGEETRKRMSESQRGKVLLEKTKQKISKARRGKKMSEESKTKISLANTGKKHTEETKKKWNRKGKAIHSDEYKKQVSEFWKGRIFSKETINKIVSKVSKPVIQYDLQGNFIKEWKSAREIERCLGINYKYISACCRETRSNTCGFIWKFKNKEEIELIKETKP